MSQFASIVRERVRAGLRKARVALPGRVVSYDKTTQTAEVQLQLEFSVPVIDRRGEVVVGRHVYEALPNLYAVPVGHPRGGGYFVHFPLQGQSANYAGDFVWVMFSDHSLDEFIATGKVSRPRDLQSHGFFPYAIPASDPSKPGLLDGDELADDALVVGREGGAQLLLTQDDEVLIGAADAAEALPLGTTLQTYLDSLSSWLSGLLTAAGNPAVVTTAIGATAGTSAAIAAYVSSNPVPTVPTIKSAKHKLDQ